MICLEEPKDDSVIRVETRNSFQKLEVIGFPGKVRLAEPKTHTRDPLDVLVCPTERPNLVFRRDEVAKSLGHVAEKLLLLLDHEKVDRPPEVRDLLELTGLLTNDPVEEGVLHIRSS